ncbi:hypothetical protein GCM10010218_18660 [Streptomyces mashuensis]|uniref:Uncharacterized protein n=1 Tax=Streptomyces mashuensis TaxID=33904 RepID=A0A919EC35_9ACTN|nr:hypothetical protein [Streptomyces mashuensis]GHF37793.1 hypothetical protein GCM10010218_18660 [Streptomyces mashuensis]
MAVLADERDFAAMRRYRSFGFDDHATYLRQVDGLLRALAAQGTHTNVTLFDPTDYEDYCTGLRLDPDTPASRTRYTADVASAGARLVYDGRPLTRLLPDLVHEAEQQATWEYAAALLARTGADNGRTAFSHASRLLRTLVEAAGPGTHHFVCSVPLPDTTLTAALHTTRDHDRLSLGEASALVFSTVLAAGLATGASGGIVLRTTGTPDTVRGWLLRDGRLRPLTASEVFAAYCTDPLTGEPVPPEPGVEYEAGHPLE